jgi:gamma-glutamylaminecyclotransferase
MALIFVYGTLKRGEIRAGHLAGQVFAGLSKTNPDYRIFRVADYPGLVQVEMGTGCSIQGEVWDVDKAGLQRLDWVEGVESGEYERRRIGLTGEFKDQPVQAYFYLRSVANAEDCGNCW